jgi:hypothetical protein
MRGIEEIDDREAVIVILREFVMSVCNWQTGAIE